MTVQQLHNKWLNSHTAFGAYGEQRAASLLWRLGLMVIPSKGCDLIAVNRSTGERWRIEVKTAKRSNDGKYRFTCIKRNHTHTNKSDIVICLAYDGGEFGPFIIPVKDIIGKSSVCITSNPNTYNGKYAKYKNNWSLLS
jgi:hypothetical protein